MKNISAALFLLFISFASCSFTSKKFDNPNKDKDTVLLEIIEHVLENAHFSPVKMDDSFSKKVFDSYLKNTDGQKRYFLQSDINEFKKYENRLDDDWCTMESVLDDNAQFLALAKKHNTNFILIDDRYKVNIEL